MLREVMPRAIEWNRKFMDEAELEEHFDHIAQYWPDLEDVLCVGVFANWVRKNHTDQAELMDEYTYPITLINEYVNVNLDIRGSFVLI
jgi:hypothetical protein